MKRLPLVLSLVTLAASLVFLSACNGVNANEPDKKKSLFENSNFIFLNSEINGGLLQAAGIQVNGVGSGVINGLTISAGDTEVGVGRRTVISLATEAFNHGAPDYLIGNESACVYMGSVGDAGFCALYNGVFKSRLDIQPNRSASLSATGFWLTAQPEVTGYSFARIDAPLSYALIDARASNRVPPLISVGSEASYKGGSLVWSGNKLCLVVLIDTQQFCARLEAM
jgi:hypothetical protein